LKGTYSILIVCRKSFRTKLGKLGYVNVRKGFYLYTGSALGNGAVSLEGRLNRHFRSSKNRRWHVDYLTSHRNCAAKLAIYLRSSRHLECSVNRAIDEVIQVRALLPRAGSSDCRCQCHLNRVVSPSNQSEISRFLKSIYRGFGKPVEISTEAC
jgi:Uri superfamily endonuclease